MEKQNGFFPHKCFLKPRDQKQKIEFSNVFFQESNNNL